jgi:hypothetical protein
LNGAKTDLFAKLQSKSDRVSMIERAIVVPVVPAELSTAIGSGLPVSRGPAHPLTMGSKSRETIYGASVRAAAERAAEARKQADRPGRSEIVGLLGRRTGGARCEC